MRAHSAKIGAVVVAISVGALIPLVGAFALETLLVCGVALATVVMLGPIFSFGGRALMEPITYYASISFVVLGASALFWLGTPSTNPVGLDRADILVSLGVVIVAFIALWLGYFAVRHGSSAAPEAGLPTQVTVPDRSLVLALATVGVLTRLIQVATNTYGYQTSINLGLLTGDSVPHGAYLGVLAYAGVALEASIFLAAVRVWARHQESARRADWALLWFLIAVEVAFGFLSGFKSAFIGGAIIALICYGKYRQRVPWKPVLVCIVLVVVSVPFNVQFRSLALGTEGENSPELAYRAVGRTISDRSSASDAIVSWAPARLRQLDNVAVVVRDTPEVHPMLYGRDLLISPAVILVPRAVWPEKPVIASGFDFAQEYLGQRSNVTSSTGVTQIGDLFRNFGWAGVALGMFLLGLVFGGLSRVVRRAGPTGSLLVAASATILIRVESDWIALLAAGVRIMAVTGLIALVVRTTLLRKRVPAGSNLGFQSATA